MHGKMVWRENYFPLTKGKAIGVHSRLLARATCNIVVASNAHVLFGLGFEGIGVCGHGRELVV